MRFGQGSCCVAALRAASLWDFFLGWGNKDVWSSTQWTLSAEWVVGLCFRRLMYDSVMYLMHRNSSSLPEQLAEPTLQLESSAGGRTGTAAGNTSFCFVWRPWARSLSNCLFDPALNQLLNLDTNSWKQFSFSVMSPAACCVQILELEVSCL